MTTLHPTKTSFDLQEEKERNGKLSYIMMKENQRLAAEHRWAMSNVCPKCHVVKLRNGKCAMGCD